MQIIGAFDLGGIIMYYSCISNIKSFSFFKSHHMLQDPTVETVNVIQE